MFSFIKFNKPIVRVYYILGPVLGIQVEWMNVMWFQSLITQSLVLLKRYKGEKDGMTSFKIKFSILN